MFFKRTIPRSGQYFSSSCKGIRFLFRGFLAFFCLLTLQKISGAVPQQGGTFRPGQAQSADVARVRAVAQALNWDSKAAFFCYQIPALSPVKRLPGILPEDGQPGRIIRVVAARDCTESASFLLFPFQDLAQVELRVEDLQGSHGVFSASQIDVRLVKCWFKGGTAWHSYFADPQLRTLVPELLLHDQNLVRVDVDKQENYVRVDYPDGSVYRWMSYPSALSGYHDVFNHATEPVQDADKLLPFRLQAGQLQQFWVNLRVPKNAVAGLYRGKVIVSAPGQAEFALELQLRVLPLLLPEAKTAYDLSKPFHSILYNTSSIDYYRELLDQDDDSIEKQVFAELQNLHQHNAFQPLQNFDLDRDGRRQLELLKKAGMRTDEVFYKSQVINWQDIYQYENLGNRLPETRLQALKKRVQAEKMFVENILGACRLYGIGWDEPGMLTLRSQQPLFAILHELGLSTYSTAKKSHQIHAGFNEDAVNLSGTVDRETARAWHAMGSKVFAYANPHTGPENPDLIRRTHGFKLYKSDYDGTANYRYYGYRSNIWNDFTNPSFRIRFVYPTRNGVIDTMHWEAFRAALDDIRYATALQELAAKAIARGDMPARYAGRKALRFLALMQEDEDDLNEVRLECIRHILGLMDILEGGR